MLALTIIAFIFFAALVFAVVVYNGLVRKRNAYKNAFAQIDVQLQRRFDLVPNLVESVKGYMAHEQNTLQNVIAARNGAQTALENAKQTPSSGAMKKLSQSNTLLNGALRQLAVVVENYPELKANQNMLHLQEELSSTENKVAFSRQSYNDAVMLYNTAIESFPQNLAAGFLGFEPACVFQIDPSSSVRGPIRVDFTS